MELIYASLNVNDLGYVLRQMDVEPSFSRKNFSAPLNRTMKGFYLVMDFYVNFKVASRCYDSFAAGQRTLKSRLGLPIDRKYLLFS